MKEIIVQEAEAGQRLDRLLSRYLKEASRGFLYKMLRKKNITLNGKKAQGREIVRAKDRIRLFLSDETYERFAGKPEQKAVSYPVTKLDIVYEDAHVLMVNKPVGMLTQKAKPEDVSLNEYVLGYLRQSGQWKEGSGSKEEPSEQLCFGYSGQASATGWTGTPAASLSAENLWQDFGRCQRSSGTGACTNTTSVWRQDRLQTSRRSKAICGKILPRTKSGLYQKNKKAHGSLRLPIIPFGSFRTVRFWKCC